MKLHIKIIVFMVIVIASIIGGMAWCSYRQVEKTIETQMGNNAMDLATTISSMEVIAETLGTTKDQNIIQKKVEGFRKDTRFNYIIVMDMDGIKYSYPIEHDLGKKYISGGEERVLHRGQAYISKDKNVLISAIRAFHPIYYKGEQVGAVLVGLLTDTVYKEISPHIAMFKLTMLIGFLVAIIGALFLSNTIKKTLLGLEPKEIALLLAQRDTVIHSLKYGILAVNKDGSIILVNKTAKEILDFDESIIEGNMWNFNSNYAEQILDVYTTKKAVYNKELKIATGKILMCSHIPLTNYKDDIIGVVSNFEDLTEVRDMAERITGFRKMTYELRAQNHEFMNKLHVISGLIQLEEYDKAVDFISNIAQEREEIMSIINTKIKNPMVGAILLGKYNKAVEAKISMEIDVQSTIVELPKDITEDEFCSVIGNLIENAIDELVKFEDGEIIVRLKSNEQGLYLWIQDNGPGISKKVTEKIFQEGVTTKSGVRGFGLSYVKKIIDSAGGSIELIQNNGTIWDIYIPMEGRKDDA